MNAIPEANIEAKFLSNLQSLIDLYGNPLRGISISYETQQKVVVVNALVYIEDIHVDAYRNAFKRFFQGTLEKQESMTCWFNVFNQRVSIYARAIPDNLYPQLSNRNLEAHLRFLSDKRN